MNNCIIIIADSKENTMKSSAPAVMCQVLFRPMLDWVTDNCIKSGNEEIVILSDRNKEAIKEHDEALCVLTKKELDSYLQDSRADAFLFICGNTPFADSKCINAVFDDFYKNSKKKTAAISDGKIFAYCTDINDAKNTNLLFTDEFVTSFENEYICSDSCASMKAETRKELQSLNEKARLDEIDRLLDSGVDIPCTHGVMISPDCTIGADTTILPGTIVCCKSSIGEGCVIGPNSYVFSSEIGNGVSFNNGQIRNAKIKNDASIGPFTQIRPASVICDGAHLGNFVEVKNSTIGEKTSVSHLTYVGDSDVGSEVNFGCGVVTVNFNGKDKNRTKIGNHAFIGCNTNLVAPVTVGENAYTAAGSTITQDVPDNALAIARERQINKDGWVKEKQPYRKKV